jgi:hypothetical protein
MLSREVVKKVAMVLLNTVRNKSILGNHHLPREF